MLDASNCSEGVPATRKKGDRFDAGGVKTEGFVLFVVSYWVYIFYLISCFKVSYWVCIVLGVVRV